MAGEHPANILGPAGIRIRLEQRELDQIALRPAAADAFVLGEDRFYGEVAAFQSPRRKAAQAAARAGITRPVGRRPGLGQVVQLAHSRLQPAGVAGDGVGEKNVHIGEGRTPEPPKATVLYAIVIPESGGDTEFASVQAAYDNLREKSKRRIAGLTACTLIAEETTIAR